MSMRISDREPALPRRRGRGRGVPLVFGVVSLVLVAVALTFALSSPPPSTPPLAEVAPAPQERIEVERVEQSSQFGEGAGGEGECLPGDPECSGVAEPGRSDQDTDQRPEVVETDAGGEFRHCPNGGLTQSADPQSPPCASEIFQGDNGGATWRGVTETTIRFGYDGSSPESGALRRELLSRYVAHFNRHYELYGRRLELVELDLSGDREDPAVQRAHAEQVIAADVFAVAAYPSFGAYQRALADAGVTTVIDGFYTGPVAEADLAALHPYAWSIYPGLEEALTISGQVICDALAGRDAQHGGPDVRDQTRRFGLVVESPNNKGVHYDPSILVSALEACGADFVSEEYEHGRTNPEVLLRRFRDSEVTTVVCVCRDFNERYTEAAEAIEYRPEWFLPGVGERKVFLRGNASANDNHPRRQVAHAFGLSGGLRAVDITGTGRRYDQHFWFHAARESDPDFECCSFREMWNYGRYAQLLVVASGIQAAGPELTPTTFGDGLTSLAYPNPGVGEAPWFQPSVGFGPNDHGFNSDFSLFWWRDPSDVDYEAKTDNGEVCYVGGGTRFTVDTVPADADDLFFDPEAGCR